MLAIPTPIALEAFSLLAACLILGGVFARGRILWLDFWYGDLDNPRCREPTGLEDAPENRKKAGAWLDEIRAQIRRGTFEYKDHFPRSSRCDELLAKDDERITDKTPVKRHMIRWLAKVSPIRPDGTVEPDGVIMPTTYLSYQGIVKHHIIPLLGDRLVGELAEPGAMLDFREALEEKGLSPKRIHNVLSALRGALAEPIERGLLPADVVPRYRRRRKKLGHKPAPLGPDQVRAYLKALPSMVSMRDGAVVHGDCLADLFVVWFATGWRENEIVALRFDWLSSATQEVELRAARSPRRGGLEADPKTGQREVDCSYAPLIFEVFERRRRASLSTGRREYVFTDSLGRPLSQEWLHKRVWKPTIRKIGLSERGMNAVRDTFITTAIDQRHKPSWIAGVCGTSERMIWDHYKGKLRRTDDGAGMAEALGLGCDSPLSQETVTTTKKSS